MSKTCNNCKYSKRKMSEEQCFSCEEKDNFEPQTNRQWLENLSDEEFAKIMYDEILDCGACPIRGYCKPKEDSFCKYVWYQWLKAEHKE